MATQSGSRLEQRECLARTVRPTLVVGVGGTGAGAAKHVKARMQELVGGEQPYLAIRAFDTDQQSSERPHLVEGTEYIYLGGFNAQAVIADIDPDGVLPPSRRAYPHWAKWLPPRLSHQQVAVGAGGIRPIGRLCYFYRREQIREAVQDALQRITDPDAVVELEKVRGIHMAPGITIHLCGSVCGGTGSGMFLDLAFDLRRWAEKHTMGDVSVIGHLVLPEAFRGKPVVDRALQANSYIALQELDHFMNARPDQPWEVEYRAGEPERSRRAPFDTCYLLSGGQNGSLPIEDMTAAVGEAVVLLTAFDIGHIILKGETNTANQSKAKIDAFGRSCCYSSYGVIGIDVPGELVAAHLVDRVRLTLAEQAHPSESPEFDSGLRAAADRLRKHLEQRADEQWLEVKSSRVQDGAAMEFFLDAVAARPQPVRSSGLGRLLGGGEPVQENGLHPRMVEARQLLLRAIAVAESELERELEAKLAQPLLEAQAWLDETLGNARELLEAEGGRLADLVRYLGYLIDEVRRLEKRIEDRVATAGKQERDHAPYADEVREGGPRTDRWEDVRQAIREHWAPHQQARVDARLLARYGEEVAALRQRLGGWVRRLEHLAATIRFPRPSAPSEEAYNEEHRGRSSVVTIDTLVSSPEGNGARPGLLDPLAARIGPDLVRKIATDPGWLNRGESEADTQKSIDRFCRDRVRDYLEEEGLDDCEQLLRRSTGADEAAFERRMLTFWDRARPAWSISETYTLRSNVLEISAVGAVRGSRMYEVLLKRDRRVQATASRCRDYVPILCTQHGMSLLGLRSLPEYRQAFLEAVQHEQRFDFHFFLDTRWVTEIEFPDEPREDLDALGVFSLAVDLKIIGRGDEKVYTYTLPGRETRRARRRWMMFESLQPEDYPELRSQVEEKLGNGGHANGSGDPARARVVDIQNRLVQAVSSARRDRSGQRSPETEVNLSRDLFQLHREIRSCRFWLRPLELHPEDEVTPGDHGS